MKISTSGFKTETQRFFWLAGLCILLNQLAWAFQIGPWATYFLVGLAFPLLAYTVELKFSPIKPLFFLPILFLGGWEPLVSAPLWFYVIAVIETVWLCLRLRIKPLHECVLIFLISCTCWALSAKLLWWAPHWQAWLSKSVWTWTVLLASFPLIFFSLFIPIPSLPSKITQITKGLITSSTFILFLLASTKMGFDADSDFIVGTLQLIREGGTLLWDAPSQYGFLNIFLTSLIPAKSAYLALYLMNSTLLFLSSLIFFHLASRCLRGILGLLCSGLLTFAMIFLAPGWIPGLLGVNLWPSTGAFRFIGCYVLFWVATLLTQKEISPKRNTQLIHTGHLTWTLACLWSIE